MASSKVPVEWVTINPWQYNRARRYPGVYCNLRPHQRAKKEMEESLWLSDDIFVHEPVRRFLQALTPPCQVLMHFQGYGADKVGTALVSLDRVFWTSEPYPRLDFKHPPKFDLINGCPNFWGAFILMIAAAPGTHEEFAKADFRGEHFFEMLNELKLGATPFYSTEGVVTAEENEALAVLRALVYEPNLASLQRDVFIGSADRPEEAPALYLTARGLEAGGFEGMPHVDVPRRSVDPTLEAVRKYNLHTAGLLPELVKLASIQSRLV